MEYQPAEAVHHDGILIDLGASDSDIPGERATSLAISGWVSVPDGHAEAIHLFLDGTLLATKPIDSPRPDVVDSYRSRRTIPLNCGFHLRISKLWLPSDASLEVVLIRRNADKSVSRINIGRLTNIVGVQLATSYQERYKPLLVPALGRSGTTYLMNILSRHPEIVVPGRFPFELRQASYLWHAIGVLTAPSDHINSMHPDSFEVVHPNRIGFNPYLNRGWEKAYGNPQWTAWVDSIYPGACVDFFKRQVDMFVDTFAKGGDRESSYIGEKAQISPLRHLVFNIYHDAKEIFLVRDFRDSWLSAKQFNEKRGTQSFERSRFDTETEWLRGWSGCARQAHRAYENVQRRAHLLRYEDLMMQPEDALAGVFGYLGIDASRALVSRLLQEAQGENLQEVRSHMTARDRNDSCDRWRREMSEIEKHIALENFGSELEYFGYELQ